MAAIEVQLSASPTVEITHSCISIGGSLIVKNSDETFDETYSTDDSPVTLPNITFTDSDGSSSSVPSVKDIVATPCAAAPTISVTVSDNNPNYLEDIDIECVVTGFTPTSYTFQIACQDSGDSYVTQASGNLTWTVNRVNTIKISVTATNGTITQGDTIEITVTDPLDYATVLCDFDARNNLTLVNDEVDVIGDSSGNGHDVTASSASFRAYIDTFGSRIASKPNGFDFENSTSNPISGKADFTLFFKLQKLETAAANQRVISFGTTGTAFAIGALGTVGVDDLIIGDSGFSCRQDYQVGLTEGATVGVVKNGTDPYECYVDGSLATPVSTTGTPIANIATQNGIGLGSQNSNFNFTGIFQRLIIFDTGSFTAAQMEAINLRIKQLHP